MAALTIGINTILFELKHFLNHLVGRNKNFCESHAARGLYAVQAYCNGIACATSWSVSNNSNL